MMSNDRTVIILLLTLAIVSQAISNVLLSQGMKTIAAEQQDGWGAIFVHAAQSPVIWLGIGFVIVFFALFTAALSKADLSYVLPALSSEVVINVAFADYFLAETVSPTRWLGAFIISIGVVLVVQSSPRTFGIRREQQNAMEGVSR